MDITSICKKFNICINDGESSKGLSYQEIAERIDPDNISMSGQFRRLKPEASQATIDRFAEKWELFQPAVTPAEAIERELRELEETINSLQYLQAQLGEESVDNIANLVTAGDISSAYNKYADDINAAFDRKHELAEAASELNLVRLRRTGEIVSYGWAESNREATMPIA